MSYFRYVLVAVFATSATLCFGCSSSGGMTHAVVDDEILPAPVIVDPDSDQVVEQDEKTEALPSESAAAMSAVAARSAFSMAADDVASAVRSELGVAGEPVEPSESTAATIAVDQTPAVVEIVETVETVETVEAVVAEPSSASSASQFAIAASPLALAAARMAVSLAGTAAPDDPIWASYETEYPSDPRLSAYVAARSSLWPGDQYWTACSSATATAIAASGCDPDVPAHWTADIYEYCMSSPKWAYLGPWDGSFVLAPGDVLTSGWGDGGHTMMYVGNDAVRERFPESPADMYEGGVSSHFPWLYQSGGADAGYAVFRRVEG